jgi:lysophospholipase L1-like esterase
MRQRIHTTSRNTAIILTLFLAALFATAQQSKPLPTPAPLANKRVLWLGDSITQAGDYVTFVQYYLDRQYPTSHFNIVSIGLSSETASCLSEKTHPFPRPCVHTRLQRALTLVKPDIVIACYGMNDGIFHPLSADRTEAFHQGILKLSAAVHAASAKLILLTPPPFDRLTAHNLVDEHAPDFGFASPFQNYDSVLSNYAHWETTLPTHDASLVIDLHTPIDAYLQHQRQSNPTFSFATKDGIHPNPAGHLLMARLILHGLGLPISSASLNEELAAIQTDPLYALVKRQREDRSQGWLDFVGYTREKTVHSDSIDQVEQLNTTLQTQIDTLRQSTKH